MFSVFTCSVFKPPQYSETLTFFQRMWALCDLAMGLLISKSTTFELKEFPSEPSIPPMFFIPHEDPNFFNIESYLPQELVVQPPKKLGITIQYLQPTSATAKKKRVRNLFTMLHLETNTLVVYSIISIWPYPVLFPIQEISRRDKS